VDDSLSSLCLYEVFTYIYGRSYDADTSTCPHWTIVLDVIVTVAFAAHDGKPSCNNEWWDCPRQEAGEAPVVEREHSVSSLLGQPRVTGASGVKRDKCIDARVQATVACFADRLHQDGNVSRPVEICACAEHACVQFLLRAIHTWVSEQV
jgi:hypothetical protein